MRSRNDFCGLRFGKLYIERGGQHQKYQAYLNRFNTYICKCDCGNTTEVLTLLLIKGGTRSCGCLKIYSNITNKLYPGLKINRFIVIGFCDIKMQWKLLCECGTIYYSGAKKILKDNTKSCGCLNTEKRKEKAIIQINKSSDPNPIQAIAKRVFNRYSDGDLTFDMFYAMSQIDCFYCGIGKINKQTKEPSQYSYLYELSKEELTFRYNGLDRINSDLPHNKDNCVPSCVVCNRGKSDMSQAKFLEYLNKIAKHKIELTPKEYRELAKTIDVSLFTDEKKRSLHKSVRSRFKGYSDGDLLIHDFYQLSQMTCYYCGSDRCNLFNRAKHIKKSSQHFKDAGDFLYNGLDRMDSKRPHDYDNLVPSCMTCNFVKGKLSIEDFLAWRDRIVEKWA